jgi:exonuclease III
MVTGFAFGGHVRGRVHALGHSYGGDANVKVLCLNVQSGGGSRWNAILKFVSDHHPDVAVFTEWRPGVGCGPAKAWALQRDMKWSAACEGSTRNGVAIAAKQPFEFVGLTPGRETAGTLLQATFADWTLLAAYFPQGKFKHRYFDVCDEVAKRSAEAPFLLVGDLNTGNQITDKTLGGAKYACAERFDRLSASCGLVDLWRKANGSQKREWTWRTAKNEFRLDHAFGNSAFVARFGPSCAYDHTPRNDRFSDHSAIVVTTT